MEFQLSYLKILKNEAVKVLHSICQQNVENAAVATALEKVSFHSNPKERQFQRNVQPIMQLHSSHLLAR